MFNEMIKEICNELHIKYQMLSKNWIIMLEKDNKIRYLSGNKFDLNGHAIGNILDDKYAFYDVLKNLNIPICEYSIFYRENNINDYANECHTIEQLLSIFNKYKKDVVIKPNKGAMGIGVYHITDEKELINKVKLLLETNYSISICPFYNIKNEYRVIILDNEIKLLYKKINPVVIGDGKSTLKELLINYNKKYFAKVDIPHLILKKGEVYNYDFKFNLSRGSIASLIVDNQLKEKISSLALKVTTKANISFASIDIIETVNNELLVLEGNSGVTISKAINFIPNGYELAKSIYKDAIIKLFK